MSAFVLIAALALGETDTASVTAAMVARAQGSVIGWTGETSRPLVRGATVASGEAIDVAGWCELFAPGDARLRLGAGTRARLSAGAIELTRGRLWVQISGSPSGHAIVVSAADWRVRVPRGSSVVIERSGPSAVAVAVRSGVAELHAGGQTIAIAPGQVARGREPRIAPGGDALVELAARAAREGQGDASGLRAFLIDRSRRLPIGRLDTRTVAEIGRVDAELVGADGSLLFEEAVRPAPFFEEEVPTKGPNVRVEVEFAE